MGHDQSLTIEIVFYLFFRFFFWFSLWNFLFRFWIFKFRLFLIFSFLLHLYHTITSARVHLRAQGHTELVFVQRKRLGMWHKKIKLFFNLNEEMFFHEYSAWSSILRRINVVPLHLTVTPSPLVTSLQWFTPNYFLQILKVDGTICACFSTGISWWSYGVRKDSIDCEESIYHYWRNIISGSKISDHKYPMSWE